MKTKRAATVLWFVLLLAVVAAAVLLPERTPGDEPVGYPATDEAAALESLEPTRTPTETTIPTITPTLAISLTPTQTFTPTITPTPTATPLSVVNKNRPETGTAEEARAAFESGTAFMTGYVIWDVDSTIDRGGKYFRFADMNLDVYSPMLLSNGWCATTKPYLEQNLAHMDLRFEVDGMVIPEESTYNFYYRDSDGWQCYTRLLLLRNWPPGRHQVVRVQEVKETIYDGTGDYPAVLDAIVITAYVKEKEILAEEIEACFEEIGRKSLRDAAEGMEPVFCDMFDEDVGWKTGTFTGRLMTSTWSVTDSRLLIQSTAKETQAMRHHSIPLADNHFRDFTAYVEGFRIMGVRESSYGLVFREVYGADEASSSFYFFYVLPGKPTFGIDLYLNGEWEVIKKTTISEAIGLNENNALMVKAVGDHFECYINGYLVYEFDDDRLPEGGIGLGVMVAIPENSADYALDNLVVLAP